MPCYPLKWTAPSGETVTGMVCTGRRRPTKCRKCGRTSSLLCDFPMPFKESKTCDAPVCRDCATQVGPDRDICPDHLAAYRAQEKQGTL